MEIILKQDINKLGYKDEIVTVKDGYAANYLIPQGMAINATTSAKKQLAETLKQRAHKEEKIKLEAQKIAEGLKDISLIIGAKASTKGKIFGSVNTIQVAEALKEKGFEVDRRNITFNQDIIKEIGSYVANIRLHKEVKVQVPFEIVAE